MDSSASSMVLEPEEVARLQLAFESSWRALGFAIPPSARDERALSLRDHLAARIFAAALRGERNPSVLSREALGALPPLCAMSGSERSKSA